MPIAQRSAIGRDMGWLSRIIPDRFIAVLMATVLLASLLPVRGAQVEMANLASSAAVFVIFLLHGIRLPRAEVIAGLANWRVQGAIAAFVFGIMPLTGWLLWRGIDGLVPGAVAVGLIYCGVLPTTVQSATTYCSLARGNVAISVVASAVINLAAILVTPLLFTFIAGRAGGVVLSGALAIKIVAILLLPFAIGQSVQRWLRPVALRHPAAIKLMDQAAIAIAVYVAFSAAVVTGIWQQLAGTELAVLALAISLFLLVGFGGSWLLGGWMRLARPDRTALLFSGAHKSIAVGAPLATLLFPAAQAGMIMLPILSYHLAQLLLSAWIAPALAARAPH